MDHARWAHRGLWAALALAAAMASPVRVRAQDNWKFGDNWDLCPTECELFLTVALGLPVVVFAVGDVAYGVEGEWVPMGFAMAQISFAVTAGVLASAGVASGPNVEPGFAALLGVSIGLSLHAIASMLLHERRRTQVSALDRVQLFVAPAAGGAWTGLRAEL